MPSCFAAGVSPFSLPKPTATLHSASVGNRYFCPALILPSANSFFVSHSQNAFASSQFTFTTGCVSACLNSSPKGFFQLSSTPAFAAAYAAANAGVDESWKKPFGDEFKQADTHPVVKVNWEDANAFCEWLTKKELAEGKIKAGQKYRLPTDAEWSVAVGLGKEKGDTPAAKHEGIKNVFPWGKGYPPPVGTGNYGGSHKSSGWNEVDNYEYTSPAGSFSANKLGLHDMGGNVIEWCEDWYDPAATTAHRWGASRVLRGATWASRFGPHSLTGGMLSSSRKRFRASVSHRTDHAGFRCVLVGGSGG